MLELLRNQRFTNTFLMVLTIGITLTSYVSRARSVYMTTGYMFVYTQQLYGIGVPVLTIIVVVKLRAGSPEYVVRTTYLTTERSHYYGTVGAQLSTTSLEVAPHIV